MNHTQHLGVVPATVTVHPCTVCTFGPARRSFSSISSAETTTGFYISTGYKDVPGLVLLLIVLMVRPSGLFGKSAIKKV